MFATKKVPKDVRLFHERKVLFIHIPKTAGVSVYRGLFDVDSSGHYNFTRYQKWFSRHQLRKFYKFTFVRNPYTRLLSAYHYIKEGGRGHTNDLEYQNSVSKIRGFEAFVLDWLDESTMEQIPHFRKQSSYLYDEKREIKLDYIGKLENIDHDYQIVRGQVKGSKNLPRKNINPNQTHKNEQQKFSPQMLKKINGCICTS